MSRNPLPWRDRSKPSQQRWNTFPNKTKSQKSSYGRRTQPGIQEEDQEGTSAKRRDQEGPEGNNAPSRLERQDMSRPSTVDTTPPHIVTEMQMMRERMDFMMNALKGKVSSDLDDLVHRTDSPFTMSINSFPLPPKFRMP